MCTPLCVSVRSRLVGMSRSKLPHSTAELQGSCPLCVFITTCRRANGTVEYRTNAHLWGGPAVAAGWQAGQPTLRADRRVLTKSTCRCAAILNQTVRNVTWSSLLAFCSQGRVTVSLRAPRSLYTSAIRLQNSWIPSRSYCRTRAIGSLIFRLYTVHRAAVWVGKFR